MDSPLSETLSGMILSASGWRGVFAKSGDEESSCPEISGNHRTISAIAAKAFSEYLSSLPCNETCQNAQDLIVIGRDTRPTGEAIASAVITSLLSCGREVLYCGITAIPELMSFTRSSKRILGFIYISASHNPIGHNGFKFGLSDGGVLQAAENLKLVSILNSIISRADFPQFAESFSAEKFSAVYASQKDCKLKALAAYRDFSEEVISASKNETERNEFFSLLRNSLKKLPIGIVADFNGSARAASIDRDFLTSLGLDFKSLNDTPGEIAHAIIPEGESLESCRLFLESCHAKNSSFILGYMSDCDGDRGNLVIMTKENGARILEAQEVFALACVAELSFLAWKGELIHGNTALVVNDPTSMRIDRIADIFGASVFRSEVGEANVVALARKLREKGYLVRISGEGSAGGTIIHPCAVRDPLDTLFAILKLFAIRGSETDSGAMGLFEIWCMLSGQKEIYRRDFSLEDIISSLPVFFTSGVTSPEALLKINIGDHALFKDRYQKIFLRQWEEKKGDFLSRYGICEWEVIAYNGIEERRNIPRFGETGSGGLKIEFQGEGKTKLAFIWMRGSATENVFRIMADVSGKADSSGDLERNLIKWQREMVLEALLPPLGDA